MPNPISDRFSRNEFHHEKMTAVDFLNAKDAGNAWMVQRSQNPGLALKSRDSFGIAAERLRKKLDRHIAAELLVHCLIDVAHAPGPNVRRDFEMCDSLADHVVPWNLAAQIVSKAGHPTSFRQGHSLGGQARHAEWNLQFP